MQIRSFRGSGEPVWVSALPSAGVRLGPDPRRALGPAAAPAASTGRTRDRTRPMLHERQNVLARAPSTRDPERPWRNCLLNHLICVSEDRRRDGQAEPLGGLEVDDQLKFGGLLHREIDWLRAS